MRMNRPCTDLEIIATAAVSKATENELFREYLKQFPGDLDLAVCEINAAIEPLVDCTQCGNCCRSLMINVTAAESVQLADRLGMSVDEVKKSYLEESTGGELVINTIPCHFLADNKCTIYLDRFSDCRAFPHLDKPGIRSRLFGTLMHYGRCPIIFNVIEELKMHTNFIVEKNN